MYVMNIFMDLKGVASEFYSTWKERKTCRILNINQKKRKTLSFCQISLMKSFLVFFSVKIESEKYNQTKIKWNQSRKYDGNCWIEKDWYCIIANDMMNNLIIDDKERGRRKSVLNIQNGLLSFFRGADWPSFFFSIDRVKIEENA